MKRIVAMLTAIFLCSALIGCSAPQKVDQIVATTLPVYTFTSALCDNTGLSVSRLITENVSCLHDYTLQVHQMKKIENAQVVVISGLGLEDFLSDAIPSEKTVISAGGDASPEGTHDHNPEHSHDHSIDPHIWLSVTHAKEMADTICYGLIQQYPEKESTLRSNLTALQSELDALDTYARQQLSGISNRKIITFHDGFRYLAQAYNITIVSAMEEESGSEASARELIHLSQLIRDEHIAAIFTEINGSVSAAEILHRETGIPVYALDMAMSADSYFDAMYHNIDTLKEALE